MLDANKYGKTKCRNFYLHANAISFSVHLIGGDNRREGNVFATNPKIGTYGPVCDFRWTNEAVSHFVNLKSNLALLSNESHSLIFGRAVMPLLCRDVGFWS